MQTLSLSLLALILVSHSILAADTPTINQGANAMAAKIQSESNKLLRLTKFTKTNGQKSIVNGVENYTMDCTVETLALEDCAMTGFMMGNWEGNFGALKAQKNVDELDKFFPTGAGFAGNKQLTKGNKMTFETKLIFDLTEKGWRTEGQLPTDKPFVPDLKLPQLIEEKKKEDVLGASDTELERLRQLNTTNKVASLSDLELRQLMVGRWTTGRHDYEYKADGTWQMLPTNISTTNGTWRIESRQLIEGSSVRTIMEASLMRIVLKHDEGPYPYRYERIGKPPNSSPSSSIVAFPPLDLSYMEKVSQNFGVWNQDQGAYHTGMDISTPRANPNVYAIADGIVVWNSTNSSKYTSDYEKYYNAFVIVKHSGFFAYYGHFFSSLVISEKVGQGKILGTIRDAYSGNSVDTRANHLHISISTGPEWITTGWGYKKAQSDLELFANPTDYLGNKSRDSMPPNQGGTGQTKVATEIPEKFCGVWTPSKNGIHPPGETPTKISAKQWLGHESLGSVKQVRLSNNNEIVVELTVSAEGEEYIEKRYMRISTDGNVLSLIDGSDSQGKVLAVLYRVRQIDFMNSGNQSGERQNRRSNKKSSKAGSLRERTKQFDDL
jgi:murein DD-endopeptidase MepM/ murein hydrolase activator NlpD